MSGWSRRSLPLLLALGLAHGARAGTPVADPHEAELERANRCLRRGDLPCAERHAALAAVFEADPTIRREALVVLVTVAGRAGEEAEARSRCEALLTVWPGYEPPPDAPPAVASGCHEARRALLEARLPPTLDPGPAPLPSPAEAAIPPAIHRPAHLDDLPAEAKRFSVSIGAGLALPIGAAGDRFDAGIQAFIDLRAELSDSLALWLQGGLALLRLDTSLPVEPHQSSSLTAFTATLGLEYRQPLIEALELVVALGLGAGGFGLEEATQAAGLALSPVAGVRYLADPNLSVRADFAPTIIVPFSDLAPGGHLGFVLRGEARF